MEEPASERGSGGTSTDGEPAEASAAALVTGNCLLMSPLQITQRRPVIKTPSSALPGENPKAVHLVGAFWDSMRCPSGELSLVTHVRSSTAGAGGNSLRDSAVTVSSTDGSAATKVAGLKHAASHSIFSFTAVGNRFLRARYQATPGGQVCGIDYTVTGTCPWEQFLKNDHPFRNRGRTPPSDNEAVRQAARLLRLLPLPTSEVPADGIATTGLPIIALAVLAVLLQLTLPACVLLV
jgi:hypothetical protein